MTDINTLKQKANVVNAAIALALPQTASETTNTEKVTVVLSYMNTTVSTLLDQLTRMFPNGQGITQQQVQVELAYLVEEGMAELLHYVGDEQSYGLTTTFKEIVKEFKLEAKLALAAKEAAGTVVVDGSMTDDSKEKTDSKPVRDFTGDLSRNIIRGLNELKSGTVPDHEAIAIHVLLSFRGVPMISGEQLREQMSRYTSAFDVDNGLFGAVMITLIQAGMVNSIQRGGLNYQLADDYRQYLRLADDTQTSNESYVNHTLIDLREALRGRPASLEGRIAAELGRCKLTIGGLVEAVNKGVIVQRPLEIVSDALTDMRRHGIVQSPDLIHFELTEQYAKRFMEVQQTVEEEARNPKLLRAAALSAVKRVNVGDSIKRVPGSNREGLADLAKAVYYDIAAMDKGFTGSLTAIVVNTLLKENPLSAEALHEKVRHFPDYKDATFGDVDVVLVSLYQQGATEYTQGGDEGYMPTAELREHLRAVGEDAETNVELDRLAATRAVQRVPNKAAELRKEAAARDNSRVNHEAGKEMATTELAEPHSAVVQAGFQLSFNGVAIPLSEVGKVGDGVSAILDLVKGNPVLLKLIDKNSIANLERYVHEMLAFMDQ